MENKEFFYVEMNKLFKFNSSHFVVFKGFREPLHGHNYKVSLKIKTRNLDPNTYYVIDFGILKEIMTKICNSLKHCLLLPKNNSFLEIKESDENKENYNIEIVETGEVFSMPKIDCKIIETSQISAECLAKYINENFLKELKIKLPNIFEVVQFYKVKINVHEDIGKIGCYSVKL